MPTPFVFGAEVEYTVLMYDRDGRPLSLSEATEHVVRTLPRLVPTVPRFDRVSGFFLGNGACLYRDSHRPEYATPEVTSPADLVAYLEAGDELLLQVAAACRHDARLGAVRVFNHTLFGRRPTFCGHHYSHWLPGRPAEPLPDLTPLLLALAPLAGGGGFLDDCFCLAPRLAAVTRAATPLPGARRAPGHLFQTNRNAYGPGLRLHDRTADGHRARLPIAFQAGLVALAFRLLRAGVLDLASLHVRNAAAALQRVARASGRRPWTTPCLRLRATGEPVTLLRYHRDLLTLLQVQASLLTLPAWVDDLFTHWGRLLDAAAAGDSLEGTLDWAAKRRLVHDLARRDGFDPLLLDLHQAARAHLLRSQPGPPLAAAPTPLADLLRQDASRAGDLAPRLERLRARWDDLVAFEHDFLPRARELVVLYHELGPDSLYSPLRPHMERAAWPGLTPGEVAAARTTPPADTRARLRGEFVRAHAGRDRCIATWDQLIRDGASAAALRDPCQQELTWEPLPPFPRPTPPPGAPGPTGRPSATDLHASVLARALEAIRRRASGR